MKTAYSILLLALIFSACSTIRPSYEDSNQIFVEKTVDQIEVGSHVRTVLPEGATVALTSMELDEADDREVIALVEDQLVQSLISSGFVVLERDPQLVDRMLEEKWDKSYSKLQSEAECCSGDLHPISTQLIGADYLVSYRVQEIGIEFVSDGSATQRREGLARLHLRVQDASSGKVLKADNVSGKLTDNVSLLHVPKLSNYHFSFFSHEYPVLSGKKQASASPLTVIKKRKSFFASMDYTLSDGDAFSISFGIGSEKRASINFSSGDVSGDDVMAIGLKYEQNVFAVDKFNVMDSGGIQYVEMEKHYNVYDYYDFYIDYDGINALLGVGFDYELTSKLYSYAGYDFGIKLINDDVAYNRLSVGLRYRF